MPGCRIYYQVTSCRNLYWKVTGYSPQHNYKTPDCILSPYRLDSLTMIWNCSNLSFYEPLLYYRSVTHETQQYYVYIGALQSADIQVQRYESGLSLCFVMVKLNVSSNRIVINGLQKYTFVSNHHKFVVFSTQQEVLPEHLLVI